MLIERVVVGVDRIEGVSGDADELHRGWIIFTGKRVEAKVLLHILLGCLETVRNGGPHEYPNVISPRPYDKVAFRHLTFVTGRENEILATLPFVRAGGADILHITEPGIIEGTEHPRRRFHYCRAIPLEVEVRQHVHGRGIPGQVQRLGVHQLVKVDNLVRLGCALAVSAVDEPL